MLLLIYFVHIGHILKKPVRPIYLPFYIILCMSDVIKNTVCPKCISDQINSVENSFLCNSCGLNFCCFEGKT